MSSDSGLTFAIEAPGTARWDRFPVRAVFTNRGAAPVRLLNLFQPLPIFFSFDLSGPDGTPVILPAGGKVDIPAGEDRYLDLAPGADFDLEIDLAPLAPPDARNGSGRYQLSAEYHNQYGRDCFQGRLRSPAVEVDLS
jgi:hypothetical protein